VSRRATILTTYCGSESIGDSIEVRYAAGVDGGSFSEAPHSLKTRTEATLLLRRSGANYYVNDDLSVLRIALPTAALDTSGAWKIAEQDLSGVCPV